MTMTPAQIRQLRREQGLPVEAPDPLPDTVARAEAVLTPRVRRAITIILLTLAGGFGAQKSGVVDSLAARAVAQKTAPAEDPRVPGLAAAVEANTKETANVKRLVRWLVAQEIRRQEREGRTVDPPEDVQ
jgi:hypothetical protein